MILFTSSYDRAGYHPNAISISGYAPDGWNKRHYKRLAPKKWIYDEYKSRGDTLKYSLWYGIEVLSKLNPVTVSETLGCGSILCCYEKPGEFCHRQLVSMWFNHMGINCVELDPNWLMNGHYQRAIADCDFIPT